MLCKLVGCPGGHVPRVSAAAGRFLYGRARYARRRLSNACDPAAAAPLQFLRRCVLSLWLPVAALIVNAAPAAHQCGFRFAHLTIRLHPSKRRYARLQLSNACDPAAAAPPPLLRRGVLSLWLPVAALIVNAVPAAHQCGFRSAHLIKRLHPSKRMLAPRTFSLRARNRPGRYSRFFRFFSHGSDR